MDYAAVRNFRTMALNFSGCSQNIIWPPSPSTVVFFQCFAMYALALFAHHSATMNSLYEVPWEELQAEGIEFLPPTLAEALDDLEADGVVMEALGREYGEYYIRVKREEWKRYHDSVSQWEIDNYLGLY